MSKKKPSRIANVEQKQEELVYYIRALKNQLDLTISTLGEYIDFKKDRDKFTKHVEKKKKKVESKEK